jgi:hypothetical protein
LWCGSPKARVVNKGRCRFSLPRALWIRVVSKPSVGANGGRIVGSRRASIGLLVPGLPIISAL